MSVAPSDNNNFSALMSTVRPFAVAPIAAGFAIVPVFPGLVMKTDIQLGRQVTPFHPIQALRTAVVNAPGVAGTVGGQLMTTLVVDKGIQVATGAPPTVSTAFVSGLAVAVVTSPLLAGLAGTTAGERYITSMKAVTRPQVAMLTKREVPFLGMNAASDPIGVVMQQHFGKSKKVEYATTAVCNGVGAAAGHVHDTLFQLSQDKQVLKVDSPEFRRRAVQSAKVRIPAVVAFGCFYKAFKEAMSS